jgi:hypothetical protein
MKLFLQTSAYPFKIQLFNPKNTHNQQLIIYNQTLLRLSRGAYLPAGGRSDGRGCFGEGE